jgi:hypothetical protein
MVWCSKGFTTRYPRTAGLPFSVGRDHRANHGDPLQHSPYMVRYSLRGQSRLEERIDTTIVLDRSSWSSTQR